MKFFEVGGKTYVIREGSYLPGIQALVQNIRVYASSEFLIIILGFCTQIWHTDLRSY